MDNDTFFRQFETSLRLLTTAGRWRGLRKARLGDGQDPPTVIVPPAQRQREGMLYCFREVDGTKELIQALNMSPAITPDQGSAFFPVLIGYPPDSHILAIWGPDPDEAHNLTKGYLPSQVSATYAGQVQPSSFATLKIYKFGPFVVGLTGGTLRYQEAVYYIVPNTNFYDATADIPSTNGLAVYVSLAVDSAGTLVKTVGTEFPINAAEPVAYMPTTVAYGALHLGWVYLFYGMTELQTHNVLANPDIYYIPSLVGTAANVYTNASGDAYTDASNETYTTND